MKTIAIGDIHGYTSWEKIVNKEKKADKIIFIGDYFDSFHITPIYQIHNFKEIIAFKKANMDKVVLLIGNHDYHYMRGVKEHYSGYHPVYCHQYMELIHQALDEGLLQMCHLQDDLLFSHAGVTKSWCTKWGLKTDPLNIESQINDLFKYKPQAFKFRMGGNRSNSGDDICQTPIWVRPNSLLKDGLGDYTHVVGHTQQNNGITVEGNIILIDALETTQEYLMINNGKSKAVRCPR